MYLETIADLLALPSPITPNTEFIVGGYFDAGDGGGGTFIWVLDTAPHPYPDDTGVILYSLDPFNDAVGYFQRIFSGPVNVRWFGAIYDVTLRPDVTAYVHAARDSQAFANNGTLYFPKGEYPGAFEFTNSVTSGKERNEFNIIGDGQGTILKSNGLTDHHGDSYPVLILGYRKLPWRWAKISNLKIDGLDMHSDGVKYSSLSNVDDAYAGRWMFDQVFFFRCRFGVYKPYGNIGNHYIDCTWAQNNFGVWAQGQPGSTGVAMHYGCDRYSGGHFTSHQFAGVSYSDVNSHSGQIIFDGTVFEYNTGVAIYIRNTDEARLLYCAISIRNVYFENNDGGHMYFEGVRSVRIDDCAVGGMTLVDSSVNLYNCSEARINSIEVDSRSSLVAYEHRYLTSVSENLFVNSISYDITPELSGYWLQSSVWGPLRVVNTSNDHTVITTHFDTGNMDWDDFDTTNNWGYSLAQLWRVLGNGSNGLKFNAPTDIWCKDVFGDIVKNKYVVWSIHTYMQGDAPSVSDFHGEIIAEDKGTVLGYVYFRSNQWVCSYGMRYSLHNIRVRLRLVSLVSTDQFYITDFQVLQFDDLASANSFVNSREFAKYQYRGE